LCDFGLCVFVFVLASKATFKFRAELYTMNESRLEGICILSELTSNYYAGASPL
jgi:hypothetical protein